MLNKFTTQLRKINKYGLAAFLIPVLIMMACYGSIGIFIGTDRSVLASDAYSQFSNFHASFNNVLHGKQNLFYTWNATLGLNYYALISYYLGGIFTPLVFLFKNSLMPDALYVLTLLKIGCAGLAFWYYAKETFKINALSHVMLAIPYSLMSFVTAHSELIMWLDTFIYLPLIFLGINRVMDERRPVLLFISYFLLFVSNFYFGFMVGMLSFLYFWARSVTNWPLYKKSIVHYFITAITAGMASMVMILPTVLDLSSNGEKLTEITKLKTSATGFWDLVIKNMVGIYDTTKYGSIPFIYIGLFPLLLCVFYFVSKKIPLKNKIAYGSLFILLIGSFYFVPLNLFWHGMHAPNMFLFRYSFCLSFLVIMLAGYALEQFESRESLTFASTTIVMIGLFIMAYATKGKNNYDYVTETNFLVTILFLLLYLVGIIFYQISQTNKSNLAIPLKKNHIAVVLLLLVSFEAVVNTHGMLNGILDDWVYASRSLYVDPYEDYQDAIQTVQEKDKPEFYRIETLDPVTANDSLNYGYSGISLFSSIRNRNATSLLNDLGFRSRGTGLNIRYQNNTLLMDSLFGIKYIHSKDDPLKYGFTKKYENKTYQMYQNEGSLPAAFLTSDKLAKVKLPKDDNLGSQTNLFNQLADSQLTYYHFVQPEIVGTNNVTKIKTNDKLTLQEIEGNIPKDITWEVVVPAGKQAYLSLFPTNFGELDSSSAEVTVGGKSHKTQIDITGQYYNLGYYPTETIVSFTASFSGSQNLTLIDPPVVLLDIAAYEEALAKIKPKGVDLIVSGRKATGKFTAAKEDQVLLTTIPYDKGWTAYIDGKKTPIKPFKDGLISLPVTPGEHELKLVFLPNGLGLGALSLVVSTGVFLYYLGYLKQQQKVNTASSRKRRRK